MLPLRRDSPELNSRTPFPYPPFLSRHMCVQQRAYFYARLLKDFYYVPRADPLPPPLPIAFSSISWQIGGYLMDGYIPRKQYEK